MPRSLPIAAGAALAASLLGVGATSPRADDRDVWARALAPHAPEIDAVLVAARQNRSRATTDFARYDHTGFDRGRTANRRALLADSVTMLEYGLSLSPDDPALLRELGFAAGELGQADRARRVLERFVDLEARDRVPGEVRLRLARLDASAGRWDDASRQLRLALGGRFEDELRQRSHAVLTLALVLMHQDRLADAIDLLRARLSTPLRYSYGESIMLQFALAVAYDRDEQITRAHETLEHVKTLGDDSLGAALVDSASQPLQFWPAIDRHYFAALQYEAMGHLAEARHEWRAYAAAEGARYRDRALAHVAAIDRLRSAR